MREPAVKRRERIDYLKGACAFLVVLFHSMTYFRHNYGALGAWWPAANHALQSAHVPLFFALAGYLLHKQAYWPFLRKKLKKIILPFLVFAGLKVVYTLLVSSKFAKGSGLMSEVFEAYVMGGGYWFIYALFNMFLLAPLLWLFEGKNVLGKVWPVLLLVPLFWLNMAKGAAPIRRLVPEWFQWKGTMEYLPYFCFGYAVRQLRLPEFLNRAKPLYVLLLLAAALAGGWMLWLFTLAELVYRFEIKFLLFLCMALLLVFSSRFRGVHIRFLAPLGKYSLQFLLLDSFVKIVVFRLAASVFHLQQWCVLILPFIDTFICYMTCKIAERMPLAHTLLGLDRVGGRKR